MHYSKLIVLAMSTAVAGQATPAPIATPIVGESGNPLPTGSPQGPRRAPGPEVGLVNGEFVYLACAGSKKGFVSFFKAGPDSLDNSPDNCAKLCEGKDFFGLAADSCYCGRYFDADSKDNTIFDNDVCDIRCKGDPKYGCGGFIPLNRQSRRDEGVPSNVVLSLYVSIKADGKKDEGNGNGNFDGNGNSDAGNGGNAGAGGRGGDGGDVYNGPVINGDVNINVVCYGDWCAPRFPCPECPKYRVVCHGEHCKPELCTEEEQWQRKVVCEGEHCKWSSCVETNTCYEKVVCEGEHCYYEKTHEQKKYVCYGDECSHTECHGDDCWKKEVCEGEHCEVYTETAKYTPTEHNKYAPSGGENKYTPSGGENKYTPSGGENKHTPSGCNGYECPPATPSPVVAGSQKMTAAAGLAALVAGAVFLL